LFPDFDLCEHERERKREHSVTGKFKFTFTVVFIFLLIVSICPNAARGDRFILTPFTTLKQEYTEYRSDFITTLSGGIRLTEMTERLDAKFSAQADQLIYAENSEFNARNNRYTGDIAYRLSERMQVSSKGDYTEDSRPDRDIEESGLILGTATRKRHRWSVAGNYLLSEITAGNLSYTFQQEKFDDPDFTNYRSDSIGFQLVHNLSSFIPMMTGRLNLGYTRYDFGNVKAENYSGMIGGSWEMTETLSLLTDFGGRYTVYKIENIMNDPIFFSEKYPDIDVDNDFIIGYQPISYTEKRETWGTTWQIMLAYKGERTRSSLSLSRDMEAASGSGETTERITTAFNTDRRFSEEFRGNLSIRYYLNQTDQEDAAERHTLNIHPRIRYLMTRNFIFEASYRFTAVSDRDADTWENRNTFFIRLVFQYPLFD